MSQSQMTYTFHNERPETFQIILEPWAEEFTVPPGSVLTVNISYDKPGQIETAIDQNYFVIWLWGGCRAQVFLNGKDQTLPSLSVPSP